jgi:hypothetical protein
MDRPSPPHYQIELLAYRFWHERGCPPGTPETDWFRAERALTDTEVGIVDVAEEIGAALGSMVGLFSNRSANEWP